MSKQLVLFDAVKAADTAQPAAPPERVVLPSGWRLRWALLRSAHSFEGAEGRWAERRARGLTDAELTAALAEEFGIWGGSTGFERGEHLYCWCKGGKHPECGLGFRGDEDYVRLRGFDLLRMAREILAISVPGCTPR